MVAVGDAVQVTDDFLYASQKGQGPMKVVERLDDRLDLLGLDIAPHVVPSGESFEVTVKLHARQKTTLQEASLIIHSQSGIRVAIVDLRNDRDEVTFSGGRVQDVCCTDRQGSVDGGTLRGRLLLSRR